MDIRLIWLALGAFAIGAEGFVISTLLPSISAETGVTIAQAGYLVLAYAVAYALSAPVLATLTGTAARRNVLVIAAFVFAAGAVGASLANGYWPLLAARVVMAAMAGLYAATAQATAVSMSEPAHRARAIAVVVGGTSLAVALGAPIGGLIAGLVGWRGTYLFIAALGLVAAGAILAMLPSDLRGEHRSLRERLGVLSLPGVVPALLTTFFYMVGPFAAFIYLSPLATRGIGLDKAWLPAVMLAWGAGAAIGNTLGGQLADRMGANRTVILAALLNAVFLMLLSVAPHLNPAIRATAFIALMVPWGIVAWTFLPAQVSRLVGLTAGAAPLVLSLNGSSLYLGTAGGALLGAQVLEHASVYDLGWVSAISPVIALAILGLGRAPRAEPLPRLG
ncbi:MAG TPA: MFS transporter [Devosia sp.]|nr:MFS transporter [Devosia sp.]